MAERLGLRTRLAARALDQLDQAGQIGPRLDAGGRNAAAGRGLGDGVGAGGVTAVDRPRVDLQARPRGRGGLQLALGALQAGGRPVPVQHRRRAAAAFLDRKAGRLVHCRSEHIRAESRAQPLRREGEPGRGPAHRKRPRRRSSGA